MNEYWIIRSTSGGRLYWSNTAGWGRLEGATHYTAAEQATLSLPAGGEWLRMEGRGP